MIPDLNRLRTILKAASQVDWRAIEFRRGECPVCDTGTVFVKLGPWLRDYLRCLKCWSIPRYRALWTLLTFRFPNWRQLSIHECSPFGPLSRRLRRECRAYTATHFFPGEPPGKIIRGFRSEDLEHQTFPDESFDLVITQDVFEHVFDAAKAFSEIARTLKKGGAHVFTVPWKRETKTLLRAERKGNQIEYLAPAEYHGNPVGHGSLVVRDWGDDLTDFIREASGLLTEAASFYEPRRGLEGEFLDVFISRKT